MCKTSESRPGNDRQATARERATEAAFERLFSLYYSKIHRWVRGMGFDKQDAEDIAQETFIRVAAKLGTFRGESTAYTWIQTIARNQASNHLRGMNAEKRRAIRIPLDEAGEAQSPSRWVPSPDPDPEKRLLTKELLELLDQAIEDLPPQRKLCTSLLARGLKYKEIAQILDISIESVKSHLHQARKQLKARLRERFRRFDVDQEDKA